MEIFWINGFQFWGLGDIKMFYLRLRLPWTRHWNSIYFTIFTHGNKNKIMLKLYLPKRVLCRSTTLITSNSAFFWKQLCTPIMWPNYISLTSIFTRVGHQFGHQITRDHNGWIHRWIIDECSSIYRSRIWWARYFSIFKKTCSVCE